MFILCVTNSGVNDIRAALAKEATDAIRICIACGDSNEERTKNVFSRRLRQSMRESFLTEHVVQIVFLTKILDTLVIAPRSATYIELHNNKDISSVGSPSHRPSSFAMFEKDLW